LRAQLYKAGSAGAIPPGQVHVTVLSCQETKRLRRTSAIFVFAVALRMVVSIWSIYASIRFAYAAGRIAERRSATRSKIQTRPLQFSNQAIGSETSHHRNFSNAL
jgi:hypothetical protein